MKRPTKKRRRLSAGQVMSRIVPTLPDTEFVAVTREMKRVGKLHPGLRLEEEFFITLKMVREAAGLPWPPEMPPTA